MSKGGKKMSPEFQAFSFGFLIGFAICALIQFLCGKLDG